MFTPGQIQDLPKEERKKRKVGIRDKRRKRNQELKVSVNSSLGFILFLGKCQGAIYWIFLHSVTKVPNINNLRGGDRPYFDL